MKSVCSDCGNYTDKCDCYLRCSECFMFLKDCTCTDRTDKRDELLRAKAIELVVRWIQNYSNPWADVKKRSIEAYNFIKTGEWE